MPTIVGILTFMSRINFVLSLVEHGKSLTILGPRLCPNCKDYQQTPLTGKVLIQ